MKKILLVFEDYTELTTTDVYLKKVGFDVIGISNEVLVNDQILAFNPDIIVASGKSQRVSSLSVGMKLKDNVKYHGRVVIILPKGFKPSPQEMIKLRMDAALDSPVQPVRLIQILAKLSNLDTLQLIEKFKKATLSDPILREKINIAGMKFDFGDAPVETGKGPQFEDKKRMKQYEKFLKTSIDSKATSFTKNELKERQNTMKKDWDFDELEELDKLKQEFAAALFKKDR